ncbi:hypothetical protein GALMADRAFT_1356063 [Galerina marginata CBS 339.88]|uniref:J domain-containing protein n=1 Tax=Galerina marginata (strain CBS 339.88) TaxID=685588 RepID=A0A067S9B6_GALM3|nr:hypothetical protein GALMADRAFT_1356063 [Galerina marginata CBS 339.88]
MVRKSATDVQIHHNPGFIDLIKTGFFNSPLAFGYKFKSHYVSSHPEHKEAELTIPIVVPAATAVALYERREEKKVKKGQAQEILRAIYLAVLFLVLSRATNLIRSNPIDESALWISRPRWPTIDPDKNPNNPHAEERFKEIAITYQSLSDDTPRHKYNKFGPKESAPEGGYIDLEEVFRAVFGGERFAPTTGHMKTALQEAEDAKGDEEDGRDILSPEEKAEKERDRIKVEKDRLKAAEKAAARAE